MKCPNCGAENDATNSFCEQCGTRLAAGVPGAQAAVADAPTVSVSTTCMNCGAQVLPGQAFCDECGTALPAAAVTAPPSSAPSNGTAYQDISLPSNTPPREGGAGNNLICQVCGHQNLPGDQFCDNCGAALSSAPATQSTQSNSNASALLDSEAPTMIDTTRPVTEPAQPSATIPDMPSGPDDPNQPAGPVRQPPAEPPTPMQEPPGEPAPPREEPPAPGIPEQEPSSNPPLEAPPAQEPEPMQMQTPATPSGPGTMDMATYEAERKRLEDEIARQQQIIAQLEPVQNALGAATPAGVVSSLQQARNALVQAMVTYDTLQPPPPAVDPAEIARLEGEIARQQQIIAQLEPVQNALGAATPAGVADSLQQARAALQQAQAALAAINGGTGVPEAAASAPSSTPEQATAPADDVAAAAPQQDMLDQTEPASPPPEAMPAAPRFVLEDGKEIVLPPNKQEIIIGREDPISGVYPEIDLTPYGGESGGVSRQHARLNQANGQWTITDLNSTNYTRVDGNKIDPNTPVPVQNGSRVQLGRVAMTFHDH